MIAYFLDSNRHFSHTKDVMEGIISTDFTYIKPPRKPYSRYLFDGKGWHLISKLPKQEAPSNIIKNRTITKLEFMSLFTDLELAGIFTSAKSDVAIEVWVEKLKATTEVHLDNPQLIAGVKALEVATLIAVGRADIILAG